MHKKLIFLVVFFALCENSLASIKVLPGPFVAENSAHSVDQCQNVILFKGEWEYLFFLVNPKDVKKYPQTIHVLSPNGAPIANLFVSVPWPQLERFSYNEKQKPQWIDVDELLLLNTKLPAGEHWENNKYIAPDIPIASDSVTIYKKSENPVLGLLRIQTDTNSKQGHYVYKIISRDKPDNSLSVCVDLKDYGLPADNKIRGIYYRAQMNEDNAESISEEILKSELEDIYSHGFTSISVLSQNTAAQNTILNIAKQIGISGPYVVQIPKMILKQKSLPDGIEKMVSKKSIFIMGIDEPNNARKLKWHLEISSYIHSHKLRVFTAMRSGPDRQIPPDNPTNWINYSMRAWNSVDDFISSEKNANYRTYYWQCYFERPSLNRFYSGFFLFWSKMDGIFPYVYQHFRYGATPYTSDWLPNKKNQKLRRKMYLSTYPGSHGPVPTMQWEAFKLGDDDYRFALLFEEQMERLSNQGKSVVAAKLTNEFNSKLNKLIEKYGFVAKQPYSSYGEELALELTMLRNWVKSQLLNTNNLLKTN